MHEGSRRPLCLQEFFRAIIRISKGLVDTKMIPGTQASSKIGKDAIEHVPKLMSTSDPCTCARLCLKDILHGIYCSKKQEIGEQIILAGTKNSDSVLSWSWCRNTLSLIWDPVWVSISISGEVSGVQHRTRVGVIAVRLTLCWPCATVVSITFAGAAARWQGASSLRFTTLFRNIAEAGSEILLLANRCDRERMQIHI